MRRIKLGDCVEKWQPLIERKPLHIDQIRQCYDDNEKKRKKKNNKRKQNLRHHDRLGNPADQSQHQSAAPHQIESQNLEEARVQTKLHEEEEKNGAKNDDDPFDCSDMAILPTKKLVDQVLEVKIKEWKELLSRIIANTPSSTNPPSHEDDENDNENENENVNLTENTKNKEWGWNANRIKLPDYFDYTNERGPPSPPPSVSTATDLKSNKTQSRKRRRRWQVLDLEHPTNILDYETELWKLFDSIPTEQELENIQQQQQQQHPQPHPQITQTQTQTQDSMQITNTVPSSEYVPHLQKVIKEIENGNKAFSRLDGHSLGRMRKKDRHHWPRMIHSSSTTTSSCRTLQGVNIKIECWRRGLKRAAAVDPHRLEMEFDGHQTLYHVHCAIVAAAKDQLFEDGMRMQRTKRKDRMAGNNNIDNNGAILGTGTGAGTGAGGMFFIEGQFYVIKGHDVDYVTPIINWLDRNEDVEEMDVDNTCDDDNNDHNNSNNKNNDNDNSNNNQNNNNTSTKKRKKYKKRKPNAKNAIERNRRQVLNIPLHMATSQHIHSMEETRLDSLSVRFGMRYLHVFHGDCESALFFSDARARWTTNEFFSNVVPPKPLYHDVWTPSHPYDICRACERLPAVVVTYEDEMTDGDPTNLCSECYRKLHFHIVKKDRNCGDNNRRLTHDNHSDDTDHVNDNVNDMNNCNNNNYKNDDDHDNSGVDKKEDVQFRLLDDDYLVYPLQVLHDQQDLSVGHQPADATF